MVNRREVFACLGAVFVSLIVPTEAKSEQNKPPRKFHRLSRDRSRWEPIDPLKIQAGDEVWVDDGEGSLQWVVHVIANDPQGRVLEIDYEIDRKTNQWVWSATQPTAPGS